LGFSAVMAGQFYPAEESHQDAGEKFPLAEEFYQVPGDDFSPV